MTGLYRALGARRDALATARMTSRLLPNDPRAFVNLTQAVNQAGKHNEALRALGNALRLGAGGELRRRIALAYQELRGA